MEETPESAQCHPGAGSRGVGVESGVGAHLGRCTPERLHRQPKGFEFKSVERALIMAARDLDSSSAVSLQSQIYGFKIRRLVLGWGRGVWLNSQENTLSMQRSPVSSQNPGLVAPAPQICCLLLGSTGICCHLHTLCTHPRMHPLIHVILKTEFLNSRG